MTADAVMGIDLGTSVVKAGIYTFDGRLQATASVPLRLIHGPDGRIEQDLDEMYGAAAAASRACLASFPASRVAAVAMDGQMAGIGIVDSAHRPAAPYDSWLDTRCGDMVAELGAKLGERITQTAGCAPTISIGPKMLWWRRHRPDVCENAASFVTASGYVAGRAVGLAGKDAFIDPSYLHFTSVADVGRGVWDEDLAADAGIDARLLPRIVESTQVVGTLTPAAAADFGLPTGVPMAAGCGDTAATALGGGVAEAGQSFDSAGTAGVFGVCLPSFLPDTAASTLMTMRSALPGRWYALGYVSGAGQLVEWACRELLGRAEFDDEAYAALAAAVARVPVGSNGVLVFPHFTGQVAPAAAAARGAFLGLTPTTTRDQMARATLESIALEYRRYAEIIRATAGSNAITEVIGTGGGSRLAVWNQMKADVLGVPYRPVAAVDTGTRGAAIVAMASLGVAAPDLGDEEWAAPEMPDPAATTAYKQVYELYRRWADVLVDGYNGQAANSARRREQD